MPRRWPSAAIASAGSVRSSCSPELSRSSTWDGSYKANYRRSGGMRNTARAESDTDSDTGGAEFAETVRKPLAGVLPSALVPGHVHVVREILVNANGKTDIAATRARRVGTARQGASRPGPVGRGERRNASLARQRTLSGTSARSGIVQGCGSPARLSSDDRRLGYGMCDVSNSFEDQDGTFLVLVNDQGQHSLWPVFAERAAGRTVALDEGPRDTALAYVEEHWSDMRPRSLREAADAPAA